MHTRSLLAPCVLVLAGAPVAGQTGFRATADDGGCRDAVRNSSKPAWWRRAHTSNGPLTIRER